MKTLAFLGVLLAAGFAFRTAAMAEGIVNQYCMESADGSGGSSVTCTYESMAQCLASKGSPSDRCYANPRLGGGR
jgi:hypothetical protein